MKLTKQWNGQAAANKATGRADISLAEHLAATGQTYLPQARVMQECLDELVGKDLIEAAYLRGSLGRGYGDVHSDIDFFLVAEPAKIPQVYDAVSGYLNRKGGIITGCHDRVVPDYGGIGFSFAARHAQAQQLYQFDLYMAMKGVAPAMPFSIKPRIYAKDPNYNWMGEFGTPRNVEALPQSTKDFMKRHTTGGDVADRVELIAQEMMLTIFMTSKHLKRGQTSRLVVDNKHLVDHAIEMLQAITGYHSTGYSSTYLGNEVSKFCRENGDHEMVAAANKLEGFFNRPVTGSILASYIDFASDVLSKGFPDRYTRQKEALDTIRRDVLDHGRISGPQREKTLERLEK